MFERVHRASHLEPAVLSASDREPADELMSDAEIYELTRRLESDPASWSDTGPSLLDPSNPVEMLGLAWSTVDLEQLTGAEKVDVLRARRRVIAHHQARLLETVASLVDQYEALDDDVADAHAGASAEVQAAMVCSRRAAESDVHLAWRLRDDLPTVLEALRTGAIDLSRARTIVHETVHLAASTRARVVEAALPAAPSSTVGQLRSLIRRLCLESDPESAARRCDQAHEERSVTAELTEAGTACITATDLSADRVAMAMNRIDRIARSLRTPDETRTMDQLRADVFLDLLEGTRTSTIEGTLDIRVDLTTLIGLENRAAELAGFGPVIADIARRMTERFGPSWRIGVLDAAGGLIHSDVTRRRPDAATRRHVQMRDQGCVFPGCRHPATDSDLDHRTPHAQGGPTHRDSLAPLCRHHHRLRHHFGWTHVREPDGSHEWHSPLGKVYTRPPPC